MSIIGDIVAWLKKPLLRQVAPLPGCATVPRSAHKRLVPAQIPLESAMPTPDTLTEYLDL